MCDSIAAINAVMAAQERTKPHLPVLSIYPLLVCKLLIFKLCYDLLEK